MKVCMVSDSYYPHPGGVTEHIHHTAVELRKLGHTVKILTASFGDNQGFNEPDILRVGRSILVPANKSFASLTVGLSLPLEVKRILRAGDFDLVHTHGPLAPTLPVLALLYSNSVNIATFHAASERFLAYEILSPVLMPLFKRIHGPIAVSEVARETIARYFPGDYRIIPNGVDTGRFNPRLEPISEYSDERQNILFVGRFDPRKGLKYLLMAMPRILKSVPKARLLVVGKGFLKSFYRRYLDPKAQSSVVFVGYVEPDLLPRYYATADVFCSPATGAESFGIILLESMAAGTPLVASDIDGYRQVVSHMEDGIVVPPFNPEALGGAIVKLLKNESLRRKFRENGLKKADHFSWRRVTRSLEQYYIEVMERVPSR
ncbi:MAG: glycosyltransferase family 4 protein [bacterium]